MTMTTACEQPPVCTRRQLESSLCVGDQAQHYGCAAMCGLEYSLIYGADAVVGVRDNCAIKVSVSKAAQAWFW
eukprot:1143245-Pelagomonas_calceolata.AAC.2